MYQALYRKWRPKTFDEVVGQEHITQTLKHQIQTGRLSHAYLFIGTRGTGKTTCAKILAKAVNCEHPVNGNPCGKCPSCIGIDDGSVLDVVELDAASNNGVDNVRALREEAIFSPASVKKRVYIIDEVHMLSVSAFNALLKILEEPPEHLMFILATTELNKVPATILSRCQRHSFKRLNPEIISKHLEYVSSSENIDIDHDASELIARLAEGGMRDALSLLDQCSGYEHITVDTVYSTIGLAGKRSTGKLLDFIAAHNTASALELFQEMWQEGRDPATMLGELNSLERDILMTAVAPEGSISLLSGGYDTETLKEFAEKLSTAELISQMTTIQTSLSTMRTASNPKSAAELCIISLCEPQLLDGISELRARVSRIEKALNSGISLVPQPTGSDTSDKKMFKSEHLKPAEFTPAQQNDITPSPDNYPPWDEEPPGTDSFSSSPETLDDDLDPEQFVEFQPEDDFLDRKSQETASLPANDSWTAIANRAEEMMPPGLKLYVNDPKEIKGIMNGDSLRLYVNPDFTFSLFNKPDILNTFRQAAGDVLGKPINVTIAEMDSGSESVTRSIDELKNFKEVHFTGGN